MKCWRNRWKRRAVKRRLKNRKLEKRIKELTESRDNWKNKAQLSKDRIHDLEQANDDLEVELKKN